MEFLSSQHSSRFTSGPTVRLIALLVVSISLLCTGLSPNAEASGLTPFRVASSASTGQTTSVTITRPLGTLADDVMIAAITILSPGGGIVFTPPAGWSEIRTDIASGEIAQALFYKVATNSEPASYTFSHSQSREASATIASYWGIDTANPINAHSGLFSPGSVAMAPGVATTVAGTTLVAIFGSKNGDQLDPPPAFTGPPADMVERWQQDGVNGIQGFDEHFDASGGTGNRTTTGASSTMGQLLALTPAQGTTGTVLFPTRNSGSLTDAEQVRVHLLESWGFTVRQIYSNASLAEIATESSLSDAVYISEEVPSSNVRDDYTASCLGIVDEDETMADFLLLSNSTNGLSNDTEVYIKNNGHDITQPFLLGNLKLFRAVENNQMHYLTGMASGGIGLASEVGATSNNSLVAFEIGSNLTDNSPAAGRRVFLPWGAHQMGVDEILDLLGNGQQMMRRSVEWVMASNNCVNLTKRAFLTDGTPVADGSSLPVGTKIHFMLYIENSNAGTLSNINVSDVLDPAFQYMPIAGGGTLKVDNSVDIGASDAAIYSAVSSTPNLSEDLVNGSLVAGYTPGTTTISAGSDAGNATLNIAPNKVWAILFEVTLQP